MLTLEQSFVNSVGVSGPPWTWPRDIVWDYEWQSHFAPGFTPIATGAFSLTGSNNFVFPLAHSSAFTVRLTLQCFNSSSLLWVLAYDISVPAFSGDQTPAIAVPVALSSFPSGAIEVAAQDGDGAAFERSATMRRVTTSHSARTTEIALRGDGWKYQIPVGATFEWQWQVIGATPEPFGRGTLRLFQRAVPDFFEAEPIYSWQLTGTGSPSFTVTDDTEGDYTKTAVVVRSGFAVPGQSVNVAPVKLTWHIQDPGHEDANGDGWRLVEQTAAPWGVVHRWAAIRRFSLAGEDDYNWPAPRVFSVVAEDELGAHRGKYSAVGQIEGAQTFPLALPDGRYLGMTEGGVLWARNSADARWVDTFSSRIGRVGGLWQSPEGYIHLVYDLVNQNGGTPGTWRERRYYFEENRLVNYPESEFIVWNTPDIIYVAATGTPDGCAISVAVFNQVEVSEDDGATIVTGERKWLFKRSLDGTNWPPDAEATVIRTLESSTWLRPLLLQYDDGIISVTDGIHGTTRSRDGGQTWEEVL